MLLFADATRLRLFPPLRAAWARVGKPAIVPVTGRNDRCVLFGALNVCTGHRIIVSQPSETGPGARALLTEIRRRYRRCSHYLGAAGSRAGPYRRTDQTRGCRFGY